MASSTRQIDTNLHGAKKPNTDPVFIALDLPRLDKDFAAYKKLDVTKKLQLIKSNILQSYEDIKKLEPGRNYVVVWREYGVTDHDRRSISQDSKKLLKEMMNSITKDRPDLHIVSGPTLIRKPVKKSGLKKVLSSYSRHSWLRGEEQKIALAELSAAENSGAPIEKLKNSSFISHQGKIVGRFGKAAITQETKEEPAGSSKVAQPAKGRHLTRIHKFAQSDLQIGFEVCNDHNYGVLKKYSGEHKTEVDLQLVLSDSNPIMLGHLIAKKGLIHVDSVYPTCFYLPPQNIEKSNGVKLYRRSLISPGSKLELVPPTFPLHFLLLGKIKEIENNFRGRIPQEPYQPTLFAELKEQITRMDIADFQLKFITAIIAEIEVICLRLFAASRSKTQGNLDLIGSVLNLYQMVWDAGKTLCSDETILKAQIPGGLRYIEKCQALVTPKRPAGEEGVARPEERKKEQNKADSAVSPSSTTSTLSPSSTVSNLSADSKLSTDSDDSPSSNAGAERNLADTFYSYIVSLVELDLDNETLAQGILEYGQHLGYDLVGRVDTPLNAEGETIMSLAEDAGVPDGALDKLKEITTPAAFRKAM